MFDVHFQPQEPQFLHGQLAMQQVAELHAGLKVTELHKSVLGIVFIQGEAFDLHFAGQHIHPKLVDGDLTAYQFRVVFLDVSFRDRRNQ